MNKFVYIVGVLMFININLFSQLIFTCDNLNIFNVIQEEDTSEMIVEEHGGGPYLNFECEIKNVSDSIIKIFTVQSRINILFFYKQIEYMDNPVINGFEDEIVYIKPNQSVKFGFGTDIFFFTNIIYEPYKKDYTKDLMVVLPTLKIEFIYNKHESFLGTIKNVEVHY